MKLLFAILSLLLSGLVLYKCSNFIQHGGSTTSAAAVMSHDSKDRPITAQDTAIVSHDSKDRPIKTDDTMTPPHVSRDRPIVTPDSNNEKRINSLGLKCMNGSDNSKTISNDSEIINFRASNHTNSSQTHPNGENTNMNLTSVMSEKNTSHNPAMQNESSLQQVTALYPPDNHNHRAEDENSLNEVDNTRKHSIMASGFNTATFIEKHAPADESNSIMSADPRVSVKQNMNSAVLANQNTRHIMSTANQNSGYFPATAANDPSAPEVVNQAVNNGG